MDLQLSWFFGICVTGFLFLTGWIIQISLRISMVNEIKQKVGEIDTKMDSIHLSLVGNMDKEGLISRVNRIDKECKLRHKEAQ